MSQAPPNCFPLDISDVEASAGFKRRVLALQDFIGPFGDQIEVVGRKLSAADIVLKWRIEPRRAPGQIRILYRHIRYGVPDLRGRLTDFYRSLRHRWWRRYLRGDWPWQSRWHHLAYYETPDADCAERLNWRGIIGRPFHEYVA